MKRTERLIGDARAAQNRAAVRVAIRGESYVVYGYKGLQALDQIHNTDVIRAFECFAKRPSPGEPYNLGGVSRSSGEILKEMIDTECRRLGCEARVSRNEVTHGGQ